MSHISINKSDFEQFSKDTQNEIIKFFFNKTDQENVDGEHDNPSTYLTKTQVDKYVSGLSDKSKQVLLAILKIKRIEESFIYEDFLKDNGFESLGGVFSGLTRRIRNITGNPHAEIIYFRQDPNINKNIGLFHPETLKNLKEYFNIK